MQISDQSKTRPLRGLNKVGGERAGRGLKSCEIRFEGRNCVSWEASSSVLVLWGRLSVLYFCILYLAVTIAPRRQCAFLVVTRIYLHYWCTTSIFTGLQLGIKTMDQIGRRIRDPHPNITAHVFFQLDYRSFQTRRFRHIPRVSACSRIFRWIQVKHVETRAPTTVSLFFLTFVECLWRHHGLWCNIF